MNLPDANIWRIKSNGDSLTKLTENGGYYQPEWNENSDAILFYDCCAPHNFFITDFYGNFIDTLPNNLPTSIKWINDSLIFYKYQFNIYCLNIFKNHIDNIYSYMSNISDPDGIVVTKQLDLIFCKIDGIYSLKLYSNNISLLKSTCNAKQYLFPTYSSFNDKIIWQRLDYTLIDKNNVFIKSRLVIMNSDGTNERLIDIPNN
jgi:hypothetical protein